MHRGKGVQQAAKPSFYIYKLGADPNQIMKINDQRTNPYKQDRTKLDCA
jgi:hypothetical protein